MDHHSRGETEARDPRGLRPQDRYRVGDLFIDGERERVIRSGREIRLSKLTFDLLITLVRAAPELVSVDALIEQVWAGSIVGPETVSQRVKRLRLALGDDPKTPRYVGGVRSRGYRVIAPVSPWVGAATPAAERARLSVRSSAAIALAVAAMVGSVYAWIHAHSRAGPAVSTTSAPAPTPAPFAGRAANVPAAPTPQSPAADAPAPDASADQLYGAAGSVPINEAGLRRALVLLDGAIAQDPGFARAIEARAEVRIGFAALGYPLANGLEDAERDAHRALALQPHLAMADAVLGVTSAYRGNWSEADARFRAALNTPRPSAAIRSEYAVFVLESVGRVNQALAQAKEAYRVAPNARSEAVLLASVDLLSDHEAEAETLARRALDLGYPATTTPLAQVLAAASKRRGQYTEAAEREVDSLPATVRSAGGARAVRLVYAALADPDRRPAARRALEDLLHSLEPGDIDVTATKDLIGWLTEVGALDSAYDLANHSLDALARSGTVGSLWGVLWTPEMRPFRTDPRFQAFAERLKLVDYWRRYGPPDDCSLDRGKLSCD